MTNQIRNAELLSLHKALVVIAESAIHTGLSLQAVHAGYIRRLLAPQVDSLEEVLQKITDAHAKRDWDGKVVSPEPGKVEIADMAAFLAAQAPVLTAFADLPRVKPLDWAAVEATKAKLSAQMIDALLASNMLAGLPNFTDEPTAPAVKEIVNAG